MRNHIEVNRLTYLPYHFLLVSVGNAGYLKYQVGSQPMRRSIILY